MKIMKKTICLLLVLAMCLSLGACSSQHSANEEAVENTTVENAETISTAEPDPNVPVAESEEDDVDDNEEETSETEESVEDESEDEELSEVILAEMEILDAIDYSNNNFLTEAEFYDLLSQILALHGLEMTRYTGTNGYYYFDYNNIDGVRLLTVAKTMEEIEADREQAAEDLAEEAEEYAAEKAAIEAGTTYVAEDDEEEDEETEEKTSTFDSTKDVENSTDYVTTFALCAGTSEVDEQVMFLVCAAAWAIMHPNYNNTDDAFEYLWRGLYTIFANYESSLSYVSTIDGIDSSYSFRIPGNAVEALMTTDDDGNYVVLLTMYAEYDELIDIAGTTGTAFQSATSSLLG